MITLNLTEEKAQALVGLLDLAVKAGGLQAAQTAVVLVDDIVRAIQAHQEKSKSEPPA